jgi:hypothetical protein
LFTWKGNSDQNISLEVLANVAENDEAIDRIPYSGLVTSHFQCCGWHPEQPGCLAARLLADDQDIKPRHFGDVMSTGKLLSPHVYFQIEMEN